MNRAAKSLLLAHFLGAGFSIAACTTPPSASPSASAEIVLPQAADAYFIAGAARAAAAPETPRARNVILFIGDGMGVTTVTAARIYAGQRRGVDGESHELAMDRFPHLAHSRTYSHDHQVADSAATATAMTTGVKTRSGVLGVTSAVPLGDCTASAGHAARTIFEIAEARGLSTGIVSTARLTHATPAAAYSHSAHRDWENDAETAAAGASGCVDIARQLIEWPAGDGFEIALGGGRANFLPNITTDPEHPDQHGLRRDGRDLAAEWAARPGHVYAWNAAQLATAGGGEGRVLGLFSPSHMAYEVQRARDPGGEPSLTEMTAAAIRRLAQDRDGYVLMVEGGRIDHAHHDGRAGRALEETLAYDQAIQTALDMTSRDDTLIVVTADHSHVLSFAGYARRGNPILGLAGDEGADRVLARDGKPYTTLGYANGPGAAFDADHPDAAQTRADLSAIDTADLSFRQQALVPLESETHGGEDVPLYAWGPGDAGFAGTLEENVIFHLMARALGFSDERAQE